MHQCYVGRRVFKGKHEGSAFDLAAEQGATQICNVCKTHDSKRISKRCTDEQKATRRNGMNTTETGNLRLSSQLLLCCSPRAGTSSLCDQTDMDCVFLDF